MRIIIRLRGLEVSSLSILIVSLLIHRVRAVAFRFVASMTFGIISTNSATDATLGMATRLIWNRVWYWVEDRLIHCYRMRNWNRLWYRDSLWHHHRYLLMNRNRNRLGYLDWHVFRDFH